MNTFLIILFAIVGITGVSGIWYLGYVVNKAVRAFTRKFIVNDKTYLFESNTEK